MLMQIPRPLQQSTQNPYVMQLEEPTGSKKKLFLLFGGVALLLLLLGLLLFGGKSKPGQPDMKVGLQNMSEALGAIDEYESDLQGSSAKNDIALIRILLRGNFQNVNDLYNKTYKPKKRFSNSPKPSKPTVSRLDNAVSNNAIDSEIFTELKPKINAAERAFSAAKISFKKQDSVAKINNTIADLKSIEDIINRPR